MARNFRQPVVSWGNAFFWRVDADYTMDVSFPFSAGFGCGASMKVSQGQKLSLLTAVKFSPQLGAKIGVPGAEISANLGGEITETLIHEISASYEWSYTSEKCEFCLP